MILNPASNVCLKIDKLKLELDLLDVEAGSHGINIQGKVLSLLEASFDLISSPSPSMKMEIMGRTITAKLGYESLLQKVKSGFFSVPFQIINKKLQYSRE